MRILLSVVGGFVVLLTAWRVQAGGPISANGFTCQATPSQNGQLVECDGQFPGVTGLFGATGRTFVQIEYSPDNKRRYYYMSDTGCLILSAADNSAVAIDRAGTKKSFPAFLDAMSWCYSGQGQQQGPPPAGAPPQTK